MASQNPGLASSSLSAMTPTLLAFFFLIGILLWHPNRDTLNHKCEELRILFSFSFKWFFIMYWSQVSIRVKSIAAPRTKRKCPDLIHFMHSRCSCISKRKLIESRILQVTDVWDKPVAKMVRNNVILSITTKVGLLFLCLYRYIRASTISLVSVLNLWTLVHAKTDITKQSPSSFLHSCGNACEKLYTEWQGQIGTEETCPFAGTSASHCLFMWGWKQRSMAL